MVSVSLPTPTQTNRRKKDSTHRPILVIPHERRSHRLPRILLSTGPNDDPHPTPSPMHRHPNHIKHVRPGLNSLPTGGNELARDGDDRSVVVVVGVVVDGDGDGRTIPRFD
jgi:hypothetical protein